MQDSYTSKIYLFSAYNYKDNVFRFFRYPSSVFGAYTLDVIASTGFGVDIDSQKNPDSEFVKNAQKFFNITFNPLLLLICKFLNEYACIYVFIGGWVGCG